MSNRFLYFIAIFAITMGGVLVSLSWTPQALVDAVSRDLSKASIQFAQDSSGGKVLGVATVRTVARSTPIAQALPQPVVIVPSRRGDAPRLTLVDAHAAVVLDADSGAVLFDQRATNPRAIASLTKLYTAYLVRSSGIAMNAPVTITEEMLSVVGSRVGCKNSYQCVGERLQVGEVIDVKSLLAAMLVSSANDAAKALAFAVSGSQEAFVDLMNRRARELGMAGANFCTPNGLESDENAQACVASAMSIAQIARKTINDKLIWSLLNTSEKTITSIDGKITHKLVATNRMVRNNIAAQKIAQNQIAQNQEEIIDNSKLTPDDLLAAKNKLPNMIGAKTGFTPLAGYSVLLAAKHPEANNSARVVAVILGDVWRWRDIKTLIDWTFDSYQWK